MAKTKAIDQASATPGAARAGTAPKAGDPSKRSPKAKAAGPKGVAATEGGPESAPAPHRTVDERIAAGQAARATVARKGHAGWTGPADRPDPVEILAAQAADRIPDLVPIRHARMSVSPFTFYRGAAAIMAVDLGSTLSSGISVQLCGDAHLLNFGVYAAPDRRLVFDVNDFDETHTGPWEWDLKRLGASLVVAARGIGYDKGAARDLVLAAMRGYRERMLVLADQTDLDAWYARIEVESILDEITNRGLRKRMATMMALAEERDSIHDVRKLTVSDRNERRFVSRPPLLMRISDPDESKVLHKAMSAYASSLRDDVKQLYGRYRVVDLARKVVGVGSVGLAAYAVLLQGRDDDDPLFLQLKEARGSVLAPVAGGNAFAQHGHRVVAGQRLMQAASDIFLGWTTDALGRDLYVRQLTDMKWSMDVTQVRPKGFMLYARVCGESLALAHARSGDRLAIAGYLGHGDSFDRAIGEFSESYAAQNDADYRAFKAAVADGRLAFDARALGR
jgi:uncharacterized protein (DUF2252 family)